MANKIEDILQYYLGMGLKAGLSREGIFNLDTEYPHPRANEVGTLENLYFHSDGTIEGIIRMQDGFSFDFSEITEIIPHMRSLSKLTEPIIVEGYNNGKPFVPMAEIYTKVFGGINTPEVNIQGGSLYTAEDCIEKITFDPSRMFFHAWSIAPDGETEWNPPFNQFELFQLLLKWHFNVFNLTHDQFVEIEEANNG